MIIRIMQRSARLWTIVTRKAIKIRALRLLQRARRRQTGWGEQGQQKLDKPWESDGSTAASEPWMVLQDSWRWNC
jgi:hypothetical protein